MSFTECFYLFSTYLLFCAYSLIFEINSCWIRSGGFCVVAVCDKAADTHIFLLNWDVICALRQCADLTAVAENIFPEKNNHKLYLLCQIHSIHINQCPKQNFWTSKNVTGPNGIIGGPNIL